MSEIINGKKTLLTKDDLCLYCTPTSDGSGIYVNLKEGIFFEYEKVLGCKCMFVLTEKEAKQILKELKATLTEEQRKLCKTLWSDF
jgi:hypothetical protein